MQYLDELKILNLPKDQYAIFGSGPIGIRNLREINDLDIIVKEDLWNELINRKGLIKQASIMKHDQKKESIKIGNIEIFKDWKPWFDNVNELIDTAEIINGFPFVRLDYLIEWKKALGREKDLSDIELINHRLNR